MSETQMLVLVLVFLAVAALAYGIAWLILRPQGMQDRLEAITAAAPGRDVAPDDGWRRSVVRLAAPLAKLATPDEGKEESGLRARFLHAGYRQQSAPMLYFAAKAGLALGLPALALVCVGLSGIGMGRNALMAALLGSATLGYFLPSLWLKGRIARRRRELFEAFPDAVDLIIVCLEAGLGLDAAIARAGEEIRLRSPALADEFHLITLELRVGASRARALRGLARRTGLEEAGCLVTMLLQADRFGSNIADSLRVHADALRTRHRVMAEEAAQKIPLKLLFPLVFCLFPALFVLLLGPAVIGVVRVLLPGMAQS
ncbi:MAG: type II secretion system F family protein [Rhodocyclales bacterium]|nr:type II secretion system F family protein [Rhodocyclales bacterium]